MQHILCSTGAVVGRPNGRDFTLLTACLPHLRCDGFELLMYEAWYDRLDDLRRFLCAFPAPIPVLHVDKFLGDRLSRNAPGDKETVYERFAVNCRLAREIGSKTLVMHLWGGVDSDRDIAHNIACCRDLRAIADAEGLRLTVENVVCSHADPLTHLRALTCAYPDIAFTYDTKMAQFHRQTNHIYKEENRFLLPHLAHMHINDFGGTPGDFSTLRTLHIGQGSVDFDSFFKHLRASGYRGDFTVEATSFDAQGRIDCDSLNSTFDRIRAYLR